MIVFAALLGGLKSNWDTLTIENTVIHPLLTVAPTQKEKVTDLSYTISAYTEGNTPESELNALIDLADNTTSLSIPQSTINHYIEQHSLEISLIHPLAAYTSSDLRVQYSVFMPALFSGSAEALTVQIISEKTGLLTSISVKP